MMIVIYGEIQKGSKVLGKLLACSYHMEAPLRAGGDIRNLRRLTAYLTPAARLGIAIQ